MDPSRRGEERQRVRWPTVLLSSATDGGFPLVLARFVRGLSTHQDSGCLRRLRTAATAAKCHRAPVDSHRVADQMPTGPFDEPTTSTARRVAAATWMMSSTTVASRASAVVPAGGRDGHAAAHLDQVALRQQVQRGIEPMQAVVTAPRAAQTHNLHRAGGRFGVAFVLVRLRALDTAGVLGRTSSLFRAALVAMSLQELAYQSWPRRCSSRSSSLSLICRASLDERKALASAKTTLGLDRRHHPNDVLDATGRCPREPV